MLCVVYHNKKLKIKRPLDLQTRRTLVTIGRADLMKGLYQNLPGSGLLGAGVTDTSNSLETSFPGVGTGSWPRVVWTVSGVCLVRQA